MATFLDVGILGYFSVIFAFLLVFVLMYGILSWVKPFGEKQLGIYAILSLAFAILSVTNTNVLRMVYFLAPWFFMLVFIGFIILFALMIFGWDMATITERTTKTNFKTYAIIIVAIVIVFGIGSSFGQDTLEATQSQTTAQANPDNASSEVNTQNNIPTVKDVDPTELKPIINTNPKSGTPASTATNDFGTNALNTLVNPQVLGMILVLLIGVFAMFFLTKTNID